ncbi:MAG: plasmid mobilization relaxosome protein MobC [Calditrichaeota bacterium]|nr:MAG: plasmid mobilization relaxosome protein MobC [Calditrichota bacterium]
MLKVSEKLLGGKHHLAQGKDPLESLSSFAEIDRIEIRKFPSGEILSGNKIQRKEYQKKYHQNYWSKNKRIQITFSNSEFKRIQKSAKKHKMKVGQFLKQCIFAYLEKSFIPENEEKIHTIELSIRKIGNNVNQIARNSNRFGLLRVLEVQRLHRLLNSLEIEIRRNLRVPIDALKMIQNEIENSDEFLNKVEWLIYHHKMKKFNDCQNREVEKQKFQKVD